MELISAIKVQTITISQSSVMTSFYHGIDGIEERDNLTYTETVKQFYWINNTFWSKSGIV